MRAHLACSISRFIQCILIIWEIMNAEGLMEGGREAEKGTLTEEGRERLREEGREGLREETSKSVPLCNRPLGHIVKSGARLERPSRDLQTLTRGQTALPCPMLASESSEQNLLPAEYPHTHKLCTCTHTAHKTHTTI